MLLTIIFAHFNALIYHFKSKKPAPISTTMVKLVQLDTSTFHPQSSQPLLVASSATQIVPPFVGQSSSQPSSSILQSTHFFTSHFSLRDFLNLNSPHPQSASPPPPPPNLTNPFQINRLFPLRMANPLLNLLTQLISVSNSLSFTILSAT